MADPYSVAVSQIQDKILKNPQAKGLEQALENVLSKLPKGQDTTGPSVEVQNAAPGDTITSPVAFLDTSKGGDVSGAGAASIVVMSGAGSVTGTLNSATDRVVVLDAGKASLGVTGSGGATIQAGSGDASLGVFTTGASSVSGGTGNLNLTTGNGNVSVDVTNTANATVKSGSGDDTFVGGHGNATVDGGSGRNTFTIAASTPTTSSGKPAAVAADAHDGYSVKLDAAGRLILNDGQGHTSTLQNINVVQFSNGSTVTKASTTDEAVISRMYEAVLNRTADSAGVYHWWDAYNSGQMTLQQVGSSFLNSAEAQSHGIGPNVDTTTFVTNLYQNLFGRVPDAAGMAAWGNALNSGSMSRAEVLIAVSASQEGAASTADSVFVSTVGGAGLDHTPHSFDIIPDGSQTVAGGAGFDVVNFAGKKADFLTSVDADNISVFSAKTGATTNMSHVDFVKFGDGSVLINANTTEQAVIARMYDAVLHRDADASGLQHWWSANESGASLQDIAHAFLTSPEFQATSGNLSNGAFVDQLYQGMFGRNAEQAGHDYWTDKLATGMSREDLVVNLAKATEAGTSTAESIKIIDHTHTY
ncbi:DUF4214 domain-containing protein [Methylobacterium sp. E-016]|uniref:DUF4214 domain-containing protein n=1 Tax=Methylobacterium sp. E-016 TaxID=2836556 RepID=UPI001FB9A96B|nr:DUF4214 domain-containing protein [Methylobacterium sp. E-016]MCJ2074449.1 DUF4214 domain-containing protein [Methylobacterium sp. E-016]